MNKGNLMRNEELIRNRVQNKKKIERRIRNDVWLKLLHFFNFLSWLLIAVILVVFERARPQFVSFFDRFYHLKLRVNWDLRFIDYLLWLVAGGIIISITGVALSLTRARRQDDSSDAGFLIIGVLSFLFLVGIELFLL